MQNHVYSQYWNLPCTSTNSVNFQDYPHPPQDHSENYPFFNKIGIDNKHPPTNCLSSDDDDYFQPDIFARYTRISHTKTSTISTIPNCKD